MKKYIPILLLAVLIVPSVVLASWWNPFSWKIFHKKVSQAPVTANLNNGGTVDPNEEIAKLQNRIDELKRQQGVVGEAGKSSTALENKDALISEIKAQVTAELQKKAKEEATANREKTLSEKVGVSRESLAACIKNTDSGALKTKIENSVSSGMKGVPEGQRGTPYSIVIGKNGTKSEIMGALPYEEVKKTIDEAIAGTMAAKYTGEVSVVEPGDHLYGNANAIVKVIEYSDLECPYCKMFHETMKRIVSESNGQVSWVYRHWPIHQNSFEKLVASECVAKLKGNDAFWKYIELIFGMMNQAQVSVSDKL